jgi:CRP-like cAMP-binding protein
VSGKESLFEYEMSAVPARPANIAVVEACSLLNPLTLAQREELAGSSFTAYAERGELIWSAGSPAESFAIVGAGFVKLTKTSPTGQEVAVDLLGPGQCFGLLVAIEGRSFPVGAVAVSNCWYLKVPMAAFRPLYDANSALKEQALRHLAPRLRKAHEMMSRLSSGRVESRIAATLFILADSYGDRVADGVRIRVPLTRQDLAEMAGTTVETAIRVLSRWQKEGVVRTDRHVLTILDETRLEAAAGS